MISSAKVWRHEDAGTISNDCSLIAIDFALPALNTERIFFCFEPSDASRAAVVVGRTRYLCSRAEILSPTSVWAGSFELPASTAAEEAALAASAVIVLLIGQSRELGPSGASAMAWGIAAGKRMLAIDVSRIKTLKSESTLRPDGLPEAMHCYFWLRDDGYMRLDQWIRDAAIVEAPDQLVLPDTGELSK